MGTDSTRQFMEVASIEISRSGLEPRSDDRAVQVLLVSASAPLREQICGRLASLKWHLYPAESGSEALELLQAHEAIEILLLDSALPDLLLVEFVGLVRNNFPAIEILTINAEEGHALVGSAS